MILDVVKEARDMAKQRLYETDPVIKETVDILQLEAQATQ
jgi:hypothetical protein